MKERQRVQYNGIWMSRVRHPRHRHYSEAAERHKLLVAGPYVRAISPYQKHGSPVGGLREAPAH